jgi:hypothetical protein
VDAGFSCPNREGGREHPGCSFCDIVGSRSPYLGCRESLREQILGGMSFLRKRYKAAYFLLYFQAYSNTFAPPEELKKMYDYGLSLGNFRELIVSTRPDCVDPVKSRILAGFIRPDRDVWVELGLQSANEETLHRVRRGHGRDEFETAFRLLKSMDVKVAVHLIFGLPGENWADIRSTVEYVGGLKPEGVKIHNLHIPRNAPILREFTSGEFILPGGGRHLSYVIQALELLPKETVIMRITCDTPSDRLAFPRRFPDKGRFLFALRAEMESRGTWQGRFYKN